MFEAENLRYAAGSGRRKRQILKGVSIEATSGVVGLLGPNGAGKTTLLRLCATVLPITHGAVTMAGITLTRKSRRHELQALRAAVGYLPQHFPVLPRYTAHQYIRYLGWLAGHNGSELEERCQQVLEAVNLADRSDSLIEELSGGMRRRVGIAQSLVTNPSIVLLDEPTTGLDPEERRRFRGLISELARARTVVISTHLVEDVVRTADTVLVMDGGRMRFQGSLEQLAGVTDPSVEQVEDGYAAIVEAA